MGPNDRDTLPAPPMLEDEPGHEGFQIGYPIRVRMNGGRPAPVDFDGFASEALDDEG